MIKSLLPKKLKVNITIDDNRLRPNLTTKKTRRFTEESFFYILLVFTLSHSRPQGDIGGFVQLIPGSYKSDKPKKITASDKIHLKCNFSNGSIARGFSEPILYFFTLISHPVHKIYKKPRMKLFKKMNKI